MADPVRSANPQSTPDVDAWVDRLRQVGAVLTQMSEVERHAAFIYFLDFYGYRVRGVNDVRR